MELILVDRPIPVGISKLSEIADARVIFWNGGSLDQAVFDMPEINRVFAAADIYPEVLSSVGGRRRVEVLEGDVITARPPTRSAAASERPVLFFPTNDTIANTFVSISGYFRDSVFVTPSMWQNEGAFSLLHSMQLSSTQNREGLLKSIMPSTVVFGNDWSLEEISVIEEARSLNIPTVCIQEGCLDWGGKPYRMQWVDYPLLQGPVTMNYLKREANFLTGNPRFDSINRLPPPLAPRIMVNCNFTYGIHESDRDSWIADVVAACSDVGVEYFISQHPRDQARLEGLPVLKSDVSVVHEQLASCSVLITRFSTLVYEAMLMGRAVIYFNPHHERMALFNEDRTGGFVKVYDAESLAAAVRSALHTDTSSKSEVSDFIRLHCGVNDKRSSARCASAIRAVAEAGVLSSDARVYRKAPLRRLVKKFSQMLRTLASRT